MIKNKIFVLLNEVQTNFEQHYKIIQRLINQCFNKNSNK